MRVETESISPTNLSNLEESRQNFEDSSSTQEQDMQDQDIVQEQIQERMVPENEINICKFYIKKCCKHGLRGSNCNYTHPAPCKKYIENPENGCRPECTNYHPDIRKYSRKLRKCYNVNCYRIDVKGTMLKRSPQVQQHALSRPQTTQFHNPYLPANSAL